MTNTSLCERLKEERKRLRLSQAEAASRSGVQRETWSRYESGGMQPGTDVWVALALMGADLHYILSGEREPLFTDSGLSHNEKALIALYRGLEGEARNTLMGFLGLMAKTGAEADAEFERLWGVPPPKPRPGLPKTAVVLETEYKGRRRGPQILGTEYAGKRTGPTIVGQETKAAPKKKRKDEAS